MRSSKPMFDLDRPTKSFPSINLLTPCFEAFPLVVCSESANYPPHGAHEEVHEQSSECKKRSPLSGLPVEPSPEMVRTLIVVRVFLLPQKEISDAHWLFIAGYGLRFHPTSEESIIRVYLAPGTWSAHVQKTSAGSMRRCRLRQNVIEGSSRASATSREQAGAGFPAAMRMSSSTPYEGRPSC